MPNLNNDSNIHYVKFMRGSLLAWEILNQSPENISDDTLYFIYQNAQTSREGKLYLGLKLISGVGDGSSSGDISLDDLGDVYIGGLPLSDKQILVYNETSGQWNNTSLSTIINTAVGVMRGATSASAGASGLVPTPLAGDLNKFLKGNGTWATINIPSFDPNVFETKANNEITLVGIEQARVGTIPVKTEAGILWSERGSGSLIRLIITMEDLLDAIENNTYSENVIYMVNVPQENDENNLYDEYLVINSHLERMGTFGNVDLSNYVKNPTFQTLVANLNQVLYGTTDPLTGQTSPGLVSKVNNLEIMREKIGNLSELILTNGNTTLVEEVNTINNSVLSLSERLKWLELNE